MTIKKNTINKITNSIFSTYIHDHQQLNKIISDKFNLYKDHSKTKKSHFFEGRHENIYIPTDLIAEVQTVLSYCAQCVEDITGKKSLKSGLWFNYMEPGHITLAHSHDEEDELYSAVYYVSVPDNSGNLIIVENDTDVTIQPVEGKLVLFPPNLVHHVTRNNSNKTRLSLGINVGN